MKERCDIVVIGAGNMATQLSLALAVRGYCIRQVYSRTIVSAKNLASKISPDTLYTNNIADIVTDAQLYIFSISDSALPHVIESMPSCGGVWVHTAGSMPMEVFASRTARYGVIYPMQTVSKERDIEWSCVPIFIEALTEKDTVFIESIAASLSQHVTRCNSQQRQALHLAAVFACNFSNHMYAIAEKLLQDQGLSFDAMHLLIRETSQKAQLISPRQAQTGPAVREDINVMKKHLAALGCTDEAELYRLISNNIINYNK